MTSGVLVLDKPAGPTSHDMVDRARRVLGTRRVGHTGTLDPFASGVLPLCVGKATRLARFLSAEGKTYRATIRFGFATTTDDLMGEPLGPVRPVKLEGDRLRAALTSLVGPLRQVPPSYSAKRVDGHRLYHLARQGVAVAPEPVAVTVHSLDLLAYDADRAEIEVSCSAGTYVRALARDAGAALGPGAHLVALRRTRSGQFGLEHAISGDGLTAAAAREALLPLSRALPGLPAVEVGPEGLLALRHGRDLDRRLVTSGFPDLPPERVRVLDATGDLAALAVPRGFGFEAPGLRVEPVLHPDVVLID